VKAAAAVAAVATLAGCGDDGVDVPASFEPGARDAGAGSIRIPAAAKEPGAHLSAIPRRSEVLYTEPNGQPIVRIKPRTEWKLRTVLSVVKRRGNWLGVIHPQLGNGNIGWIDGRRVRFRVTRWEVAADLSDRRVTVRNEGKVIRRFAVAVGSDAHPTPRGRFAVTDNLKVPPGSPYGCCVVALTARQPNVPQGWAGGDRVALHATTDTGSIGNAVSLGCLRATNDDARYLMRSLPLGTPFTIRG
jgi:lipoprotein-anchoring transpeptidase ErfK/SrfK